MATELEIGLDPSFENGDPQLLQACRLVVGERLEAKLGQRHAAEHREGARQHRRALRRIVGSGLAHELLKAARIQLVSVGNRNA